MVRAQGLATERVCRNDEITMLKRTGFTKKPYTRPPTSAPKPIERGVFTRADGGAEARPKENPVRSEAYRRLVAMMDCAHCKIQGLSQCAHADQGKGLSIKSDDRTCFPLCGPHPSGEPGCHWRIGTSGQYSREERRKLEDEYGGKTRRAIFNNGLWPKAVPEWRG